MSLPEEEVKDSARSGSAGVSLPSGLEAELQEMLWDRPGQGLVYRFRFVAPAFEQTDDVERTMTDLEHLCTHFALPKLANTGPLPNQIIISLADKPSEFGQYDENVVQVFEAFRVENDTCIWEVF
ncbi:hypothetical protein EI983_05660 [Roseovarius faecimaris]|uniref:Acetolactate synthase n=1 Tax=Roseovarius faecimaris TaxID=2494550 RepID=A0A6I6IW59_9RHOB|nr:hypothetical protein EI983_05660 [Roseovarius faecimaris]